MRLLVKDIGKQKVYIGFKGEQNYAEIAFDFSNIFAEYPEAEVALRIKPPEGETYPHSLTREENIVVWNVNASDCSSAGMGSYQVTFTSGNTIIKSFVGLYVVRGSIDVTGDPPDPYVTWLTELEEAAANVHQEIEAAKETMSGYLSDSQTARDSAITAKEAAETASATAQEAAQTASTNAFTATEASRTATNKANEANTSAMLAENYKTTAVNAASQAASASNTATQSATIVTTKASEAASSAAAAVAAKNRAEEIAESMSTQSMIAPIEYSPATSSHAVGEVFIVGNKLYKATAAIAQGDNITEGTNVIRTTLIEIIMG